MTTFDIVSMVLLVILSIIFGTMVYLKLVKDDGYKKIIDDLRHGAENKLKQRLKTEANRQLLYGNTNKKGLIVKIDKLLMGSQIRNKLPWLTTETFIAIVMLFAIAACVGMCYLSGQITLGITASAFVIFAAWAVLTTMNHNIYMKIDKEMSRFINIISNFATSRDDLIQILSMSCEYIDGPLKAAVEQKTQQAFTTGNSYEALEELEAAVNHPFFKMIIHSLNMASQHDANYQAIIENSMEILQQQIKFDNEKKAMKASRRVNILAMLGCGIFAMNMALEFQERPMIDIFFHNGLVGVFFTLYAAFDILVSIYFAFFEEMVHKD